MLVVVVLDCLWSRRLPRRKTPAAVFPGRLLCGIFAFTVLQHLRCPGTRCRPAVQLERFWVVLDFNQLKTCFSSCGSCPRFWLWTDILRPLVFPFRILRIQRDFDDHRNCYRDDHELINSRDVSPSATRVLLPLFIPILTPSRVRRAVAGLDGGRETSKIALLKIFTPHIPRGSHEPCAPRLAVTLIRDLSRR